MTETLRTGYTLVTRSLSQGWVGGKIGSVTVPPQATCDRQYLLAVPSVVPNPAVLVIILHGGSGRPDRQSGFAFTTDSGDLIADRSGKQPLDFWWYNAINRYNWIIAYPLGIGYDATPSILTTMDLTTTPVTCATNASWNALSAGLNNQGGAEGIGAYDMAFLQGIRDDINATHPIRFCVGWGHSKGACAVFASILTQSTFDAAVILSGSNDARLPIPDGFSKPFYMSFGMRDGAESMNQGGIGWPDGLALALKYHDSPLDSLKAVARGLGHTNVDNGQTITSDTVSRTTGAINTGQTVTTGGHVTVNTDEFTRVRYLGGRAECSLDLWKQTPLWGHQLSTSNKRRIIEAVGFAARVSGIKTREQFRLYNFLLSSGDQAEDIGSPALHYANAMYVQSSWYAENALPVGNTDFVSVGTPSATGIANWYNAHVAPVAAASKLCAIDEEKWSFYGMTWSGWNTTSAQRDTIRATRSTSISKFKVWFDALQAAAPGVRFFVYSGPSENWGNPSVYNTQPDTQTQIGMLSRWAEDCGAWTSHWQQGGAIHIRVYWGGGETYATYQAHWENLLAPLLATGVPILPLLWTHYSGGAHNTELMTADDLVGLINAWYNLYVKYNGIMGIGLWCGNTDTPWNDPANADRKAALDQWAIDNNII